MQNNGHTQSDNCPNTGKDSSNTIIIRNLNVYAGDHHILNGINLDIPKHKITVILGPSGCGKTTLLKSMNRLTDLYRELEVSGQICINGEDIMQSHKDLSMLRQKTGLLSQKPYPLPVSLYKNITYGPRLKGIKNKKILHKIVKKQLEEVGLWEEVKDRLNASPDCLSIGQQQRLCLARGLAVKPSVILADEPTSALDPTSSKIIEKQFLKIKKTYTIVLVTHIVRQAMRLSDHVVFMHNGKIIETGGPEVFKNPKTEKMQEYLINGN
ncbi:MAG: phosphate ABC transporter ATP-binding protein [Bacteroidales bacterium]